MAYYLGIPLIFNMLVWPLLSIDKFRLDKKLNRKYVLIISELDKICLVLLL